MGDRVPKTKSFTSRRHGKPIQNSCTSVLMLVSHAFYASGTNSSDSGLENCDAKVDFSQHGIWRHTKKRTHKPCLLIVCCAPHQTQDGTEHDHHTERLYRRSMFETRRDNCRHHDCVYYVHKTINMCSEYAVRFRVDVCIDSRLHSLTIWCDFLCSLCVLMPNEQGWARKQKGKIAAFVSQTNTNRCERTKKQQQQPTTSWFSIFLLDRWIQVKLGSSSYSLFSSRIRGS